MEIITASTGTFGSLIFGHNNLTTTNLLAEYALVRYNAVISGLDMGPTLHFASIKHNKVPHKITLMHGNKIRMI